MKISVVLCTYNGSQYLEQQLTSIAAQTRAPDEVVVCDDCSTDCTRELVAAFREQAPFPVRLHVNQRNLGVVDNFSKAISLAQGDLIALSDQDDVWLPPKLERMEAVFAARPEAGGVFTDAEVVDEDLRPRGYGVCETFGLGRREDRLIRRGETLRMLMPQNCVTGATLAFRSRFRDAIFPIPKNTYWIHDGWIAVLIATLSELVYVPERLMLYRQHADQRIGAGPPPDTPRKGIAEAIAIRRRYRSDHYAQLAAQFQQLYDRAQAFSSEFCFSERAQRQLQGKIVHSRTRAGMPAPRPARLPLILRELLTGRYHLYSSGLRSAAKDLVF